MTDLIFINPDMRIIIDGKPYKIKGTVAFIDDVQQHFSLPFNRIAEKIANSQLMLSEYVDIIRHGIEAGGSDDLPTTDAIKEYIIDEIGIISTGICLNAFFTACLMPREARGEHLEGLRKMAAEAESPSKKPKKNGTVPKSQSETTAASA